MTLPEALKQKFLQRYLSIPLHKHLNLTLHTMEDNSVTVTLPMSDHLIGNPYTAILHGGSIAAVLDAVSGLCAALAIFAKQPDIPEEQVAKIITGLTTLNFNINYLRPGKGSTFFAKATAIRSGRRVTSIQFEFYNEKDTLIAMGSANFISN